MESDTIVLIKPRPTISKCTIDRVYNSENLLQFFYVTFYSIYEDTREKKIPPAVFRTYKDFASMIHNYLGAYNSTFEKLEQDREILRKQTCLQF